MKREGSQTPKIARPLSIGAKYRPRGQQVLFAIVTATGQRLTIVCDFVSPSIEMLLRIPSAFIPSNLKLRDCMFWFPSLVVLILKVLDSVTAPHTLACPVYSLRVRCVQRPCCFLGDSCLGSRLDPISEPYDTLEDLHRVITYRLPFSL